MIHFVKKHIEINGLFINNSTVNKIIEHTHGNIDMKMIKYYV